MLRLNKSIWMAGIPFLLSVFTVMRYSLAMLLIYILAHFVILKFLPMFKHCENLGMFLIVAFSSIPINIHIFKVLNDMELLFNSFPVINILRGVLYYIVLLSVEEVIMGILTRWIWKKQHKFVN